MISFDLKKTSEDSIKDGLMITAMTVGIFFPECRTCKATKIFSRCHRYYIKSFRMNI